MELKWPKASPTDHTPPMLRNQLFHYTNNSLVTHKVVEKLPPEYPDDSCFRAMYVLKPQAPVIGCWTSMELFSVDIWFTMGW